MSKDLNKPPYFKYSNTILEKLDEKDIANFVTKKFKPFLKETFPQHYLVQPIHSKSLDFIIKKSKKHPYYLRFDILLYFPTINHDILIKKTEEIYEKTYNKRLSKRFKKYLKNDIPKFLSKSPCKNKGLPVGSALSHALSAIFLIDLDKEIPVPFLRQVDDYLLFCKNKNDPQQILKELITPKLNKLGLEINPKKLSSGRFYKDRINFIGFDFYSGYFTIAEEKKDSFKKKIIKLTHLRKKSSEKALIKMLNNKILGFGHYYKFASCKKDFEKLDAFIRMRLRRYIAKNKSSKDKRSNLLFTNDMLSKHGLKSLTDIFNKYGIKNNLIVPKNVKKEEKKLVFKEKISLNLEEKSHYYQQKLILEELKFLSNFVKKIEKRLRKEKRI